MPQGRSGDRPRRTQSFATCRDFTGFGRSSTSEDGFYRFRTIRPGAMSRREGLAPHIADRRAGPGLPETPCHAAVFSPTRRKTPSDPILALVPVDRRHTLIARPDGDHVLAPRHRPPGRGRDRLLRNLTGGWIRSSARRPASTPRHARRSWATRLLLERRVAFRDANSRAPKPSEGLIPHDAALLIEALLPRAGRHRDDRNRGGACRHARHPPRRPPARARRGHRCESAAACMCIAAGPARTSPIPRSCFRPRPPAPCWRPTAAVFCDALAALSRDGMPTRSMIGRTLAAERPADHVRAEGRAMAVG